MVSPQVLPLSAAGEATVAIIANNTTKIEGVFQPRVVKRMDARDTLCR
ncbi:hypothetical protein PR003_g11043 [Phytophthora rubi]|uniref:Uncharacterized protein n=1 Tax=Phytophthora rubi TaxID=129364 RepID=A0A6A4FPE9_9STRA|nr:hypothetical protein PR002_g10801 [Phytophthora rubi]KAE9033419.1 hypothetical protein PR001_g10171 [Phytophthora rubi]KAE9339368.1 hypothetical protein PR003_g11043 [Phytophthora rubi]